MTVADGLAQHHDIGLQPLLLEGPEVMPQPPHAGLHFVGDQQAAGGMHSALQALQIALRRDQLPANAGVDLQQAGGERVLGTPCTDGGDQAFSLRRVTRRGIRARKRPAEGVGNGEDVDPVRLTLSALPANL